MKSAILLLLTLLISWPVLAESEVNKMSETIDLIRFDQEAPSAWRTVNDGVMGGISSSSMQGTDAGHGLFTGALSLANNGGFASVRTNLVETDLSGWQGLEVNILGDGRTYQIRLRNNGRFDGVAYRALVPTREGEWTSVQLPFPDFVPTYRGRILRDVPPLDTGSIVQLTLMVADKKEGPFRLEVGSISAYRNESEQP